MLITFTFRSNRRFWLPPVIWSSLNSLSTSSQIRLCCTLTVRISNHTLGKAQHVSAPTTTILLTVVGTFHSLNSFSHVMYVPQSSRYWQNIAKLLTHSQNLLLGKKSLVGWFLWHINLCRLFNAKSIFIFKTIQFSTSTKFNCQKHFYFKLFSLFKQF